jgi:hypothetical protein
VNSLAWCDKIARSGLRSNELLVFENMISLLNGTNADTVFLAQSSHRRQTFSALI